MTTNNVFNNFNPEQDIITSGVTKTVTGAITATNYGTGSNYSNSSSYYYLDITDGTNNICSISYGNETYTGSSGTYQYTYNPAKGIYGMFKNMFNNSYTGDWCLTGTSSISSIYVLNFKQALFNDSIDINGFTFNYGGAGVTVSSGSKPTNINPNIDTSNVAYLIKGGAICGILFGAQGVAILSGASFGNPSSDSRTNNVAFLNGLNTATKSMIVRSTINYNSRYYVCRVKNKMYNYSNNPTFKDTNGLVTSKMIANPVTYITAIGLYNEDNQLIAIAKPSKPIRKSFFNQATIQIKLDF